jgi:hypothetical protein
VVASAGSGSGSELEMATLVVYGVDRRAMKAVGVSYPFRQANGRTVRCSSASCERPTW